MQKGQGGAKSGKSGGRARNLAATGPWYALAGAVGISCGLAGCAGQKPNTANNDPLLGAPSRPAVRTPAPTAAVPPVPPPAAGSLTSNAALAGGAPRPLDNANDLRINDGPRSPDSRYGQGPKDWGGTVLHPPEPLGDPVVRTPPAPAYNAVMSAGVRPTSFEQALQLLSARGVRWYELKTWGDGAECKFSCSIPIPQNPNVSRNYEARARSYLDAMQAVISQIDRERQ